MNNHHPSSPNTDDLQIAFDPPIFPAFAVHDANAWHISEITDETSYDRIKQHNHSLVTGTRINLSEIATQNQGVQFSWTKHFKAQEDILTWSKQEFVELLTCCVAVSVVCARLEI